MKTIIGTESYIDLPEYGLLNIPARVDTGAKRTTVWATGIKENDGVLQWVFFGKSSPVYNGKKFYTTRYKIVTTKNSFGVTESRYAIRAKLEHNGHIISTYIGLGPNRDKNTFPVLLGRIDLRNRALVNIGGTKKSKKVKKVAIILRTHGPKTRAFFSKASQKTERKIKVDLIKYNDLIYTIKNQRISVENINKKSIKDYDFVYFRFKQNDIERASTLAYYLSKNNIPFHDSEILQHLSSSKITQLVRLASAGLDVPNSIVVESSVGFERLGKKLDKFKFPLVIKDPYADRGNQNFFVNNFEDLSKVQKLFKPKHQILIQEFIPNTGFFRILILGGKPAMCVFRADSAHKNKLKSHLNKPHGGVNAEIVNIEDVNNALIKLATDASKVMGREVAGVDILQDSKTKKYYILEVNDAPQLVDGSFSKQKIEAFSNYLSNPL